MDLIGNYEEKAFPKIREIIVDTQIHSQKRHHVKGLIELDVTKGREILRKHREKTGETWSFTGWIMKCLGQAVNEHKHVQAMRKGKKIVIFEDVDVSVMVEREIDGKVYPIVFIIRKTNEKSFREIHDEIRNAQIETEEDYVKKEEMRQTGRLLSLPKFLRNFFFWRKVRKDPFFFKQHMGTVMATSIGMFGRDARTAFGISTALHPLSVILGGIAKKPGVIRNKIEIREYLCMTILVDHDVVDGAPAARFISRLVELVENGFGLIEE